MSSGNSNVEGAAVADSRENMRPLPSRPTGKVGISANRGKETAAICGTTEVAQAAASDINFFKTASAVKKEVNDDNPMAKKMNMRDLDAYGVDITSHSATIMDRLERAAVVELLEGMGVNAGQIQDVLVDIAYCCKDRGSTPQSMFVGKSPHCDLLRAEVVGSIRKVSTLRRLAGYYAKLVWNLMIIKSDPPSDYAAKGFKEELRYAAFDFFFGVTNSGAFEPEGGLIRNPSQAEMQANETMKDVKIRRAKIERGIKASNLGEVSGCNIGGIKENPYK